MKKTLLVLLLVLTLSAAGCSASNQSYYEHAQLLLGYGDYDLAAEMFVQLGEYRDSADYALYSIALEALHEEQYDLARANFTLLDSFKSSERYLRYLDALTLEKAGNLEAALAQWEALGSFEDSLAHVQELRKKIPADALSHAKSLMKAGRYEQALSILSSLEGYSNSEDLLEECQEAIDEAALSRAEALFASGSYEEALAAFEALSDTMDVAERTLACRSAMYSELEADYLSASLSTAEELMDRYMEMEDFENSAERLMELETRFRTALTLRDNAMSRPWMVFGQYPTGESGLPGELLWRVLSIEDSTVTLLCESVIDALPAASAPELTLTPVEESALLQLSLPTPGDLSGMGEDDLMCPATPYAMAQGVRHHADGNAWWWLGSTVRSGRNAIVWYNGTIIDSGVNAKETVVGVRPLVKLSLEELALTGGDGTKENPFH